MSSKAKKRKSHDKKKKKASDHENQYLTTTQTTSSCDDEQLMPTVSLSCMSGSPPQQQQTRQPQQQIDLSGTKEITAEEVFQASLDFKSSNSLSDDGFERTRARTASERRMLYPSTAHFSWEEKREEDEQDEDEQVAFATASPSTVHAIPETTAAVFLLDGDDNPVVRKLKEEEEFMKKTLIKSETKEGRCSYTPVLCDDAKPAAFNETLVAEVVDHDVHPADMTNGIQAVLIGEADLQTASDFTAAIPQTQTTIAQQDDYMMSEEATVIDSKPAAMPPGWSTEESAEATVIGAEQPQTMYTMQEQPLLYEEIAVTGRDEAEATVVDIMEGVHPADLAGHGVEAELIGRDYSQASPAWAGLMHEHAGPASVNAIRSTDTFPTTFGSYATILDIEQASSYDLDVPGVHAEPIEGDLHSTNNNTTTSLTASQIWAESSTNIAVAKLSTSTADVPTAFASSSDDNANIPDNSEATVVHITEDLHPADLEVPDVQAELIGQENYQSLRPNESQVWGESELVEGMGTSWVAVPGACEPQATVIGIREDTYPAELQYPGAQAEPFLFRYNPADSLPEMQAQALPLISRPQDNPRHVNAPSSLANEFLGHPSNKQPTSTDILGTSDTLEAEHSDHPVKELPVFELCLNPIAMVHAVADDDDEPPPMPVRSINMRDTSLASNVSHLSSGSSIDHGTSPSSRAATHSRTSSGNNHSRSDVVPPVTTTRSAHQVISNVARGSTRVLRTTNNVLERLFGSDGSGNRGSISALYPNAPSAVIPRTLLPWSVFPSETTGMWVATVNTNQKALDSNNITEASKALRAFSVPTKEQAEALARAWAPPRMRPFADNPVCKICESRFAVFKRPCHCRNCGVCICSACSLQWPSKMIPDTYNIKTENMVNICKSCDWLCSAFRMAMLRGDHDQAVAIHATGNVNLVTPFANVKGELFYPVHCAVLGGSLPLLQWLVDTHCCPLRSIRISGKTRQSSGSFTPILTSRGRSLLGIAMEKEVVEIVRYLVVDKGMPLIGEKDMNMTTLIRLMDKVLRMLPLPSAGDSNGDLNSNSSPITDGTQFGDTIQTNSSASVINRGRQSEASWRADEALAYELSQQRSRRDDGSEGSVDDACIICFANSIDCVVTPCGHQICCMQCSKNISRCPVCGVDCSFIRVFRAN